LFSDVFGDEPTLMAEIDHDRQKVIPYHGALASKFYDEVLDKELDTDVSRIDKRSLLIDRRYLSKKGMPLQGYDRALSQIIMGEVLCKSRLSINLALGFMLCVRNLRGLQTRYEPVVLSDEKVDE
jgi:hypothetical protein